jgi:tyrosyl-tRNA synthetase
LQLGGSDQWGNITAGTDLIRRIDGGSAHALCAPLITTSRGVKFGKTAEGAVWLDSEMTSPYKFYQFWINADDRDVESYLKVLTFKSSDEITGLLEEHQADPGARNPHRALAKDLTERIHGTDTASRVASASQVFFNRQSIETIKSAPVEVWETLESELPSWTTNRDDLPSTVVDLIAAAGLTDSKGDARRQLQQGGVYINGERADGEATVADYSLLADRYLWLRRGKKKDVIVRVEISEQ